MKWVYGILCLFFLILFHEFGHFIAAKIFGVKVESFSIGFGPVLLHKTIKGTDWRLSLLPLGGYCGMKGEKDFQNAMEANLSEIKGEKDSLYGVHPVKRAIIGFAGPFFNFIFAVLAYTIINMVGYNYYTYSSKIILADEIYEDTHSAARDAGIVSGDTILKIYNKTINDFSDIVTEISIRPDEDINITVMRNNEELSFVVHSDMDKEQGTGKIGVAADKDSLIEKEAETYWLFPAFWHGIKDSCNSIYLTFKSIKILFKGVNVTNAVSGPARVTDMLGTTVKEGFSSGFRSGLVSTLSLLAIISISLFIMNLLPIPVLDGGLILVALIEAIFHKKVSPKTQYKIQFIGLAFIGILFIIGLTGDISYFIKRGFNK